ncbi:hypothetical protein CC80DRAFT_487334 [Byssothecium circinans]|uniref:Uncharacterized protein n=1 Tax=Byssothecium circinans TaxID=147558 RepID=A0A6A5UG11_9PLEO|nr:hypothetical protein CC80DRAFT_487334 [Byssothecium circinans]
MAPHPSQNQKIEQIISSTKDEAQQIDKIGEIRGWFKPEHDSIFYPIIQAYVQGTTDLSSAVTQITTSIDKVWASKPKGPGSGYLLDLWYSIIHSSKRIPYHESASHKKLIGLVKAIKEHPEPESSKGRKIYEELADFSLATAEAYNDSPGCGSGYTSPEISAWANFNFFLALVTASSLADRTIYAIYAIRPALEDRHANDQKGWTELEAHVPAAAAWIFGMGRKLFEKEEDLTPTDPNHGNPARGGELWKGGSVFSKERWAFWKKKFGVVVELEGLKEETRRVAEEAREAMERVEKE